MQFKNVCPDISGEISDVEKKLVHIEIVSHDVNAASRDIEKNLLHVDPVIRELRENPFELFFSPPDMHGEKKDLVFSLPDMHLPTILHRRSAFVLKQ